VDEKVLKAIGDPKRYQLLETMAARSYCVSALARITCLSESSVSQHLKILREAGLIHGVKRGYYTHYQIDREAVQSMIDELAKLATVTRPPCSGPFYGCPEAEFIRCKAYIPPENRTKEEDQSC